MTRAKRSRHYLCTVNNYLGWRPEWKPDLMNYLILCHERAPSTNTQHLHFYVQFRGEYSIVEAKKLFGRKEIDFVEITYGSVQAVVDYVQKDTTKDPVYDPAVIEWGTLDPTVIVSDCLQVNCVNAVKAGMNPVQICLKFPRAVNHYGQVKSFYDDFRAFKQLHKKFSDQGWESLPSTGYTRSELLDTWYAMGLEGVESATSSLFADPPRARRPPRVDPAQPAPNCDYLDLSS